VYPNIQVSVSNETEGVYLYCNISFGSLSVRFGTHLKASENYGYNGFVR